MYLDESIWGKCGNEISKRRKQNLDYEVISLVSNALRVKNVIVETLVLCGFMGDGQLSLDGASLSTYKKIVQKYVIRNSKDLPKAEVLVRDFDYARAAGICVAHLRTEALAGKFKEEIRCIGFNQKNGQVMFWLARKALLRRDYVPASFVAADKNVSGATMMSYVRKSQLRPIQSTKLYKRTELVGVVEKMLNESSKRHLANSRRVSKSHSHYSLLLSEEQKSLINQYVDFRKKFQLVSFGVTYAPVKVIGERHKRELANLFVAMICKRIGFSYESLGKFGDLRKPPGWEPAVLNPFDINVEDVAGLQQVTGWSDGSLHRHYSKLKPFLLYLLNMLDEKCDSNDKVAIATRIDYERKLRRIFSILWIPQDKYGNGEFDPEKLFLTRREIIQVFELIRRRYPYRKGLIYQTLWMCGCFLGIRPKELIKVRLSDFKRNRDGTIWTDSDGYGLFHIADERSKMGKTGSHRRYGLLVVPELAHLVNVYLSTIIYPHQPSTTDGWLFRPIPAEPETPYQSTLTTWIKRFRHSLSFLDEHQKLRFELKTSRRSMHNLIATTKVTIDDPMGKKQQWAAQLQMRHKLTGTMGDAHYTSALTLDERKKVIDQTLNFPWDLSELELWEKKIGMSFTPRSDIVSPQGASATFTLSSEHSSRKIELLSELEDLKTERSKLRHRPKDMDANSWLNALSRLKKQIRALEDELSG